MGTWGVQPWENDGAGDRWDEVDDAAWAAARTVLRWNEPTGTADKWEHVGLLARMTVAFGAGGLRVDEAERCVEWLTEVLDDASWLSSWREPERAMQSAALWRNVFMRVLREKEGRAHLSAGLAKLARAQRAAAKKTAAKKTAAKKKT